MSSRSREGGSLPPTKFENVMLLEVRFVYKEKKICQNIFSQGTGQPSPPRPSCIAWDTGGRPDMTTSSTRTSMTREAAGELQPLLHSTSDSMLRKLVVDTTIDMDAAQVNPRTL